MNIYLYKYIFQDGVCLEYRGARIKVRIRAGSRDHGVYLHHTPPDQYIRYVLIITKYTPWSLPPVCFGEYKSVQ